MSANLLDGLTPKLTNGTKAESDGTWHHAARTNANNHDDWLAWDLPDQAALATNQTYHVGLSVRGASANATSLRATIGYEDAAGKKNWASASLAIGTSWGRVEGTIVVPSGMTPFALFVAAYGTCPETWMAAPTLSLGSPVVLAIASSTLAWSAGILATVRYYQLAAPTAATPTVPTSSSSLGSWTETEPTADVTKVLWTCERTVYADGTESWSKASKSTSYEAAKDAKSTATDAQKTAAENSSSISKLSDQISSEVKTRIKTDKTVSELSSRLTQTADGLHASIDSLSETDKKVNSWFDFKADASGNPQLKMGSSTSPVVGIYTNTGLAYKSQSGATLMELDASRSATVADHMEAQDVKIGKWKWIQTQDGTHLTLVWAG